MNREYMTILALLIINMGEPLNNSYRIIKMLDWKFGMGLSTKEILDDIKEKKYASYEITNGVHYYSLTEAGRNIVQKNLDVAYVFFLENYEKEKETIDKLFNSFQTK